MISYITDFVLDELPMSNLDSLVLPSVPAAPEYKTVDLHSVFLPTHDLYSEMKGNLDSQLSYKVKKWSSNHYKKQYHLHANM